jgi:hypothetical protein
VKLGQRIDVRRKVRGSKRGWGRGRKGRRSFASEAEQCGKEGEVRVQREDDDEEEEE